MVRRTNGRASARASSRQDFVPTLRMLPMLVAFAVQAGGIAALELGVSKPVFAAPSGYCDYADEPDADGDECATDVSQPGKNKGQPPQCTAAGDPINVGSGNLFETMTDYVGGGPNPLTFVRYNNGRPVVGPQGMGVGWTFSYGARIQSLSSTAVQVIRPDAKMYNFSLSGGVWHSDADVNVHLSRQTNATGAVTGWTLVTEDDATENYNASGQLLSIANRDGLTQTLTYSTAATPTNIAPKAGLLIAVTDEAGRQLQFTYNAQSQLTTMTVPGGGVYRYGYDSRNNLVAVTQPDGTTQQYLYEVAWLPNALTGVVDQNGRRYTTFAYDGYGNAAQSGHANGADQVNLNYGYTSTAVTESLGAQRTYTFQDVLDVLKTTQLQTPCLGCANPTNTLNLNYDPNGNLSSESDVPGDGSTPQNQAYTWDTTRNLPTSQTEAAGSSIARTTTVSWDPHFRLPATIARGSLTTSYTYDSHGNPLTRTEHDAANNLTRTWSVAYTYSESVAGAILQRVVTGPRTDLAQKTTTDYYSPDAACTAGDPLGCRGQIQRITNALGQVTTVDAYNAAGKPLQITAPNGLVIKLGYDAMNRLTQLQVGNEITAYQYDAVGNLTQLTRPDGSTVSYSYDAAHRLTGVALADGSHMAYTLDKAGDITKVQVFDAGGLVTYSHSRVFDALGRLTQDVGAYNQTAALRHDAHDRLAAQTDPRGDVSHYQYDALNRLLQVTQADGGVVTLGYDGQDHVTQATDPNGQTTQYNLDAWGDALQTASPDSGTTQRSYDPAGNVLSTTDALGRTTHYRYDALNRVVSKQSDVRGTPSYRFDYDHCANGVGRLCAVYRDGRPSERFAYDSQGRLAQRETRRGEDWQRTQYRYQPGGQLAGLTYPDGRAVQYQYDALGRVSEVDALDRSGKKTILASGFSYAPFGVATGYRFGNGQSFAQALDQDYRPTVQQSGPWVKSASYDAAGNVASVKDLDGSEQSYGYDAQNRLTNATDPKHYGTLGYGYDLNGNRTSESRNTATTAYSYSPANWLAQAGADKRLKNAAGDTAYGTTLGTLRYDGYGRLIEVDRHGAERGRNEEDAHGEKARYGYDAFGERIQKQAQGQATYFTYGPGSELLSEQDEDGRSEDYVWLNGKLLARLDGKAGREDEHRKEDRDRGRDQDQDQDSGHDRDHDGMTVYYYHTDALGTPQAMTDARGKTVWQASYEPFGKTTLQVAKVENNIRFPGQYYDRETGLSYNLNRDYDPTTGRYVEHDPMGLVAGMNVYAYVSGNPVSYADPLGLWGIGISIGISTINPFTSGGGGAYGINLQYTSDCGLHLYKYGTPNNQSSDGFEFGAGVSVNYAGGHGSWEGPFEQVDGNFGPVSFGQFDSPGGSFDNGYYGGQIGLGVGAPYGIGTTVTNYSMMW